MTAKGFGVMAVTSLMVVEPLVVLVIYSRMVIGVGHDRV